MPLLGIVISIRTLFLLYHEVLNVPKLAQKPNLSVREVTNKYRKDNLFAVPFIDKKGETKYRVFYNESFAHKTDYEPARYETFHNCLKLHCLA